MLLVATTVQCKTSETAVVVNSIEVTGGVRDRGGQSQLTDK